MEIEYRLGGFIPLSEFLERHQEPLIMEYSLGLHQWIARCAGIVVPHPNPSRYEYEPKGIGITQAIARANLAKEMSNVTLLFKESRRRLGEYTMSPRIIVDLGEEK